ncbi:hypothetical protein JOM56_005611 [Amanita muscaria]
MVKGKARKFDTGQNSDALEPPTIQVDKTLPELPREDSFGRRTKAKVQGFFSHLRPSHSRAVSRTSSEDRNSQVAEQKIPESVTEMEQGPQEGSSTVGAIDRKAVQVAVKEAERKVQVMHTMGGGVQKAADLGTQAGTTFDTVYKVSNALDPLKVFDSVVKGLGDVHPHAKVALSVLSWASQVWINIIDFRSNTNTD